MRLSWLAQLFTRSKTLPDAAAPVAPRYRPDAAPATRSVAAEAARPRQVPVMLRPPAPRDEEIVRPTKMAPQEELSIQVRDGLNGLSRVLTSIDEKLVQQQRATEVVAERLQTLPRVLEGLVQAERSSLDTLGDLRSSLDKQGAAALQASAELGKLPPMVDGIASRIEKQTEAAGAVRTSTESVGQSVRELVDASLRTQAGLVAEFRRGQEVQRERLEALVERQRRSFYVVAGLGVLVVVCLVIVLMRTPR